MDFPFMDKRKLLEVFNEDTYMVPLVNINDPFISKPKTIPIQNTQSQPEPETNQQENKTCNSAPTQHKTTD